MTNCSKCNTNILGHLWIVDQRIYCSPACERGRMEKGKWTTKYHRYGDSQVRRFGVAGLVRT